ncbi:MAG TPA: NYN domain-containing protein [Candidatus Desulfovibrio intestinigallinarum]|nr:NYN domain-containing protein [Candidatus Desulfovibrio intestinigallinarum]
MSERATFLFDGPNFYKNLKKSGLNRGHLNLMKLAQNFAGPRVVGDVVFFTSPTDSQTDAQNYINQQRFFAALQGSGVILKLGKLVDRSTECPHCHKLHKYKTEKSIDVQIAMELVLGCIEDKWDTVYLISCDADLIPAIKYVRGKGKKVVLLLPENAPCNNVKHECDKTILITQTDLNNAQV